ncbi:HEPN domain-containing protein [Persicitalea sp.]|uniref:HEPN domain-containing protein n=1 Tax=Persicitalea sp. TaxID=3100273 RepID=UPI0035934BD4
MYINISSSVPKTFKDIQENIFLFRNFFALATLSPTNIDFFNLYSSNGDDRDVNEQNSKYEVFLHYDLYPVDIKNKSRNLLFDYSLSKGALPYILKKWLHVKDDLRPILAYLVESIQPTSTFRINNFLNIVQALEGYHRRFCKGNEHLDKIIEKLVKKFVQVTLVEAEFENCKEIAKSAYDSRNYYTHLRKTEYAATKTGQELYDLTIKIRLLLVCCVLSEVGFEDNLINKMLVPGKLQF